LHGKIEKKTEISFHTESGYISQHSSSTSRCTGWNKKRDYVQKFMTAVYDNVGRRAIYQNVQLFMRSKADI